MWRSDLPYRPEVQKCRHRLLPYCMGVGLDVGCGPEKIRPEAIGVDRNGSADVNCDISSGLGIFTDEFFDYVFSSHCLEDMEFPEIVLQDWWSKLKVGGCLVLYLPHKDFYPNIGQFGANVDHKHDFVPEDILAMMDRFAAYAVLHQAVHSEDDEYSFELVLKKLANFHVPRNLIQYASPAVNFAWDESRIDVATS